MTPIRALVALMIVFGGSGASAAPPESAAGIIGGWHGKYVCAQGVTALNLRVTKGPKGGILATFRFGPLPENPKVPVGSYRMEGVFDAKTRRFRLKGFEWIDASSGYVMVDLAGRLDPKGVRLSGDVPFPGCSWFALERDAAIVS